MITKISFELFSELDHRQWFSISDLVELTGFSENQIRNQVIEGALPGAVRRKRGMWQIPREGVEVWWRNLERPTQGGKP